MLTDDDIVTLLSRDGTREDMLREAWRMGMLRAAEMCESQFPRYYGGNMEHFRQCAIAIRAAARD